LIVNFKYFKYNAGYDIMESNMNIEDVYTIDEEEQQALINETDRIWSILGYSPYIIQEL